ncbi:hypothetical protein ACSW8S_16985 (plasmid) [Clostridium perfringens]
MSRSLNLNGQKDKSPARAVTLTAIQKTLFKKELDKRGFTQTEILNKLINSYIDAVETGDLEKILKRYAGGCLVNNDKYSSVGFRITNERYEKFCIYAISLGNEPATLLRKLVLEWLGEPVCSYNLDSLKVLLKKS